MRKSSVNFEWKAITFNEQCNSFEIPFWEVLEGALRSLRVVSNLLLSLKRTEWRQFLRYFSINFDKERVQMKAWKRTTVYDAQNAGKLPLKIEFFLENNINFWKSLMHKWVKYLQSPPELHVNWIEDLQRIEHNLFAPCLISRKGSELDCNLITPYFTPRIFLNTFPHFFSAFTWTSSCHGCSLVWTHSQLLSLTAEAHSWRHQRLKLREVIT